MNIIEVISAEKGTPAESLAWGDSVAVEAGDKINCNFTFSEVTSIVRVGDDLFLTYGSTAPTVFEGFFIAEYSPKPLILHFVDREFTVLEVQKLFDTFFSEVTSEGVEHNIALRSGSTLHVIYGNEYIIDAQQFSVKNLQRRSDDLYILSNEKPDETSIVLSGFFAVPLQDQIAPKLLLTDPSSGVARDVMITPKSAAFQWQGEPLPIAVAGSLYAYYFNLEGPDADQFALTATTPQGNLPEWLTFTHLGEGKYLLYGVPPSGSIGKQDISISAHSYTDSLSLHTQQAFSLMIRSTNETTLRSGVDEVASAEFRKLGEEFIATGVTAVIPNIESMAYMPSAEIAAVSGLAVLGSILSTQAFAYSGNVVEEPQHITSLSGWHLATTAKALAATLTTTAAATVHAATTPNVKIFAPLFGTETEGESAAASATETGSAAGTLSATESPSTGEEAAPTPAQEPISQPQEETSTNPENTYFFELIKQPTPPSTPSGAPSGLPLASTHINLNNAFDGFTINGPTPGAASGVDNAMIFNMNGNGMSTLLITAYIGQGHGAVYMIPGSTSGYPSIFDVNTLGVGGTTFTPPAGKSLRFAGVYNLGDLNGDGYGDALVSPLQFYNTAYVIYGHFGNFPAAVDLGTLVSTGGGMAITAPTGGWGGAAGLGDVNGDGLSDILLQNFNGNGYVIFGAHVLPQNFDLSTLNGKNGFELSGFNTISGAAGVDLTGDGLNDIAFSAYSNSLHANGVQVIFGSTASHPAVITPSYIVPGTGLFIFDSAHPFNSRFSYSISNIGDINHDGFSDILIGDQTMQRYYVIFGNPNLANVTSLDVSTLNGTNGFTLTGAGFVGFQTGAYAGDVNGDGIPDLIIANANAYGGKGTTYVVFGSNHGFPATIDLPHLSPTEGIIILGTYAGMYGAGGGGDLTGSGLSNFLTSTFYNNTTYVINGANYTGAITQFGNASTYLIVGTGVTDVIYAGAADHQINMGSGNTFVNTGAGHDIVYGGAGINTVVYSQFDTHVYGGSGLHNTLWLENDNTHLNLVGNTVFTGFNIIDLSPLQKLNGNSVTLNAAEVHTLSNNNTLTINGDGSSIVYLAYTDNWTASSHLAGYITYTAASGSVVNVQQGVHVALPLVINDAALTGANGFIINPVSGDNGFGTNLAVAYDPLGNGFDYLMINQSSNPTGTVYLVPGSTTIQPAALAIDSASLHAISIGGFLGTAFSADILGGYTTLGTDYIGNNIGVISGGGPPQANIILNSISGLSPSQDISTLTTEILFNGPFNSMSILGAGDFNSDGFTDVFLFSHWTSTVYLVYGSAAPPSSLDLSSLTPADGFAVTNSASFSNITVATSINLSGDGFTDVVYHYTQAVTFNDEVVVLRGQASGYTQFTITDNAQPQSGFGSVMANIGNFHGGTADDLAIADPNSGTVYVIFGNASFNSVSTFDVGSLNGMNGFALQAPTGDIITAINFVGDVNGDGKADFAIATYNSSTHVSDIYVLFGTTNSFPASMNMVPISQQAGLIIEHNGPVNANQIGTIVGADLNGDGLSDIVYGQSINIYTNPIGAVYVVYGGNFSGNITIQATASNTTIHGTGNDVIFTGAFNNVTIDAGPGHNFIDTGSGVNDIINGGTANNTIVFSNLDAQVNAGTGNNTLVFEQDGVFKNFTTTSIFTGIDTIDLQALQTKVGNTIELNAATVSSMSNHNLLTINGNGMDIVQLPTAEGWTSTSAPAGYLGYIATVGPHAGAVVNVENTMHAVVFI